jgi:hypothetical protein
MSDFIREVSSDLAETNARLHALSESLADAGASAPGVALKHFAALRTELARAERLRRHAAAPALAGTKEQIEYRTNLENIQQLLSNLHARMLVERARLDRDRSHLQAAADWRRSIQQIF